MKNWALLSGILVLGVLLGYLLYLLFYGNSNTFIDQNNPSNGAFQNTVISTTPRGSQGTVGTPSFQTQSFKDKTIVIE